VDHPAVCRLTLERGHQYHLLCHQAPRQALGSYCQLLWRFRQPPSDEQRSAGSRAIRLILLRLRRANLENDMKRWPFFWWELALLTFELVLIAVVGVVFWLIVFEEPHCKKPHTPVVLAPSAQAKIRDAPQSDQG
jgi:hypothetical protein